jgi:hypothetical protein
MFVTATPHAPAAHLTAALDPTYQVVTVPAGRAAAVLDAVVAEVGDRPVSLGDAAALRLESGFRPVGHQIERWEARGRLAGPSRFPRRGTPVTVELALWSSDFGELSIRPRGRHAERWGLRRRQRHLELARTAIDELHARLQRISHDFTSTSTAVERRARRIGPARLSAGRDAADIGVAA